MHLVQQVLRGVQGAPPVFNPLSFHHDLIKEVVRGPYQWLTRSTREAWFGPERVSSCGTLLVRGCDLNYYNTMFPVQALPPDLKAIVFAPNTNESTHRYLRDAIFRSTVQTVVFLSPIDYMNFVESPLRNQIRQPNLKVVLSQSDFETYAAQIQRAPFRRGGDPEIFFTHSKTDGTFNELCSPFR